MYILLVLYPKRTNVLRLNKLMILFNGASSYYLKLSCYYYHYFILSNSPQLYSDIQAPRLHQLDLNQPYATY